MLQPLPRKSFLIALAAILHAALSASAAPITAGIDVVPSTAVQTIDLFPGTPLNPSPNVLTVVLTAGGSFTIDRQTQVGSTIDFTIPQALFSGVLPGPFPPIPFDLVAGIAGLNPSVGQIANVIQNPADPGFPTGNESSFVSGDFLADTFFALLLPGGITLYSDPASASVFSASLTSLPPGAGTVFASPDRINIYLQIGAGFDPTRDPIIGQSYDRTVTSTPEPSTFVLLLAGAAVLGVARRKRRA